MTTLAIKGNPHGTITEREVKTQGTARPAEFTDEGSLRLVVQDAEQAEAWLNNKQWPLMWRECDVLYQSPRSVSAFENGTTTKANVSRFTVAKHVNTLVPTMMSGIFYDSPPFILRPRPGTTQNTVRAKSGLFAALLDDIGFKQECEEGLESVALNGTAIFKRGWVRTRKIEKRFVRLQSPTVAKMPLTGPRLVHTVESDEFAVKEVEIVTNRPFFEHCPLGTVLIDPGWRKANKIKKAKFVIHRQYMTFNDLNKLRDQPGYDLPVEADLRALFFPPVETPASPSAVENQQQQNGSVHHAEGRDQRTTQDPLEFPLKVDERWDNDRVMTVVQDKLLIRNEEHGLGCIPFYACNWWNIQNAGYGLGIGRLVGSDQRVDQGSTNAALDILSYGVNPQYARDRGANVPTQQIRSRLGGIIDVTVPPGRQLKDAFQLIETPKIPAEIWPVIAQSKQSAESLSGADETMVQGSLPQKGGSSIGRTATGAGNLAAASAGRIQGPVGRFVENVFIPFLVDMDEMICERMPVAEIRQILGDELGEEFMKSVDMENFMNGKLKYEVLAGAHLAAKKAMAQALPLIIQIFENPHMLESLNKMGWTVDVKELFDMMMEMSEWKNSRQVIRLMSKQEQEAYQAATMAPLQMKAQSDNAKIQAKHQATSEEIDQKAEARLAEKLTMDAADRATGFVERQVVEHAMQPQAIGSKEAQYGTTA